MFSTTRHIAGCNNCWLSGDGYCSTTATISTANSSRATCTVSRYSASRNIYHPSTTVRAAAYTGSANTCSSNGSPRYSHYSSGTGSIITSTPTYTGSSCRMVCGIIYCGNCTTCYYDSATFTTIAATYTGSYARA